MDDAYMLIGGLKNKPGSTWRAKEMLRVAMLPDDDTTKQATLDEMQFLDWDRTNTALAEILDAVNDSIYVTLLVNGNKDLEAPKPAYRPGIDIKGVNKKPSNKPDEELVEEGAATLGEMSQEILRAFST